MRKLASIVTLVTALVVGMGGSPALAACGWSVVSSPSPARFNNFLLGVGASSATDAWAVGESTSTRHAPARTLAERWDGTSWSAVASQDPGTGTNTLSNVAAISPTDAWAVGGYDPAIHEPSRTLAEHWDGTAWATATTPNVGPRDNTLQDVVAVSSTDVWAVGSFLDPNDPTLLDRTLVQHWDGSTWSIVPSPSPGDDVNVLTRIVATSASNLWATGWYSNQADQVAHALALHWNGSKWKVVPTIDQGTTSNVFTDISAASASDVWAVGWSFSSGEQGDATLIEHWDGSAWSLSPHPAVGTNDVFGGVAALSAGKVLAVGTTFDGTTTSTLVERWNGTSWAVDPTPTPPQGVPPALALIPGTGQLWAAGSISAGSLTSKTLIERYC